MLQHATKDGAEQGTGGQGQGREGRVGCRWEEGDRKRFCKDDDY